MPGVPPDPVAQVKKGIKGLFSRRSRSKQPQDATGQPSSSSTGLGAPTQSSTAAAAAGKAPTPAVAAGTTKQDTVDSNNKTPSAAPPGPQIAEPSSVAEAKDIDLQPSLPAQSPSSNTAAATTADNIKDQTSTAPTKNATASEASTSAPATESPAPVHAPTAATTTTTTEQEAAPPAEKNLPPTTSTLAHGMSATSGPLGDHLAGEEFGLGAHDDDNDDDAAVHSTGIVEGGRTAKAKADGEKKEVGEDDDDDDGEEDATEVLGRKGGEVDGGVMNKAEKAKMEEFQSGGKGEIVEGGGEEGEGTKF